MGWTRIRRRGAIGWALLVLAGCGDGGTSGVLDVADVVDAEVHAEVGDPVPGVWLNGWAVDVDPASGAWQVSAPGGGAPVLRGPGCGGSGEPVRVGSGEPFVENLFGAFRIDLEGPEASITWRGVGACSPVVTAAADSVTVAWPADGGGELVLRFAPVGAADLWVGLEAPGAAPGGGELAFTCADGEGFFGLGTQVIGLDLRGRTYPLWTQEQGIGKPEEGWFFPFSAPPEAAYAPMGVWHSSAGWSAVVGHDAYSELDLCTGGDRGALRSWGDLPSMVLVAGATPKDRVEAVTRYTGRITPPADWTFAPWNDAVGGPERLYAVAAALRDAGIPSSAIWSEDWIGGEQGDTGFRLSYAWEWDPTLYPDLPADIAALHAQGFAFLGYFNPFVPTPTRMWQEGVAGGYLVLGPDGAPLAMPDPALTRESGLVDLTHPAAVSWLTGYLTTAADTLGLDGWMADFAEWLPVDARLASGESPWRVHNRYPLDWQRANRAALAAAHASGPEPANHWTFFARSGWASVNGGTGGAAPTMWGGDQNTDWSTYDGFPSVVPLGVHVGLSGVAIFGTDIAGYSSFAGLPFTDKELYFRWASQGALTGLMRTHHGSDECGNWVFDRDPETLVHHRRWARIHTLLLPVFRALAAEAVATGLPLLRHPWLVEPDLPALWRGPSDVYFLGDDLFVAPVVTQGATSRAIALPGPGWWPLFGAAPEPAAELTAAAPPTELPAYVRPGTALALLGDVVDSFYGATAAGVTDLEDVAGWYRLGLYPDPTGATRPVTLAGATVTATGLTARPDFTAATENGAALPDCAVTDGETCADSSGLQLFDFTGEVAVGDARLIVAGAVKRLDVRWAGEVWGPLAEPTPLTDLHPDIAPPCEEHAP